MGIKIFSPVPGGRVAKMSERSPFKTHPGKPSGSCVLVGLIEDKANVTFE